MRHAEPIIEPLTDEEVAQAIDDLEALRDAEMAALMDWMEDDEQPAEIAWGIVAA